LALPCAAFRIIYPQFHNDPQRKKVAKKESSYYDDTRKTKCKSKGHPAVARLVCWHEEYSEERDLNSDGLYDGVRGTPKER
jgi:hypothetical protein